MSLATTDHSRHGTSTEPGHQWQDQAACKGVDTAVFFPPHGIRGLAKARLEQRAKAYCRTCPVMIMCRIQAHATPERFGVWGGETEQERGYTRR